RPATTGGNAAPKTLSNHHNKKEDNPNQKAPVARGKAGKKSRRQRVDKGAEEPAIKVAGTADDEDQQHVSRAVDREHREGRESLRLRQQSARDSRIACRERVDRDEPPVHRDADGG